MQALGHGTILIIQGGFICHNDARDLREVRLHAVWQAGDDKARLGRSAQQALLHFGAREDFLATGGEVGLRLSHINLELSHDFGDFVAALTQATSGLLDDDVEVFLDPLECLRGGALELLHLAAGRIAVMARRSLTSSEVASEMRVLSPIRSSRRRRTR